MKNNILILLILTFTINISAQTTRKVIQLTGKISEKHPIAMTLTIENESVLGFYYYEKYKTKILLEGKISNGKVTLKESPDYESEFETGFIGEMTDSNFVGKWIDKSKDKTLKCELIITLNKKINLIKDTTEIEGTYKNLLNSEKYIGSVDLKNITDKIFYFEISNGTESGCVGFLKGLIELKDLKYGIFSTNLCEKLEFQLSDNELIVNENNCYFHGMRCPFEGKYKKNE